MLGVVTGFVIGTVVEEGMGTGVGVEVEVGLGVTVTVTGTVEGMVTTVGVKVGKFGG